MGIIKALESQIMCVDFPRRVREVGSTIDYISVRAKLFGWLRTALVDCGYGRHEATRKAHEIVAAEWRFWGFA